MALTVGFRLFRAISGLKGFRIQGLSKGFRQEGLELKKVNDIRSLRLLEGLQGFWVCRGGVRGSELRCLHGPSRV